MDHGVTCPHGYRVLKFLNDLLKFGIIFTRYNSHAIHLTFHLSLCGLDIVKVMVCSRFVISSV